MGILGVKSVIIASLLVMVPAWPTWAQSNADIAQELIKRSIANYPGNCPCPYNTDRAGRKCGKRSAYSKPGGRSPLCYEEDVTTDMIEEFRSNNR